MIFKFYDTQVFGEFFKINSGLIGSKLIFFIFMVYPQVYYKEGAKYPKSIENFVGN